MGMYTNFWMKVELNDVQAVSDVITHAIYPNHPFFTSERAPWFLSDAYLSGNTLYVDTHIKNYDDEIGKFVAWVLPYTKPTDEPIAYKYYEEDAMPTPIYNKWDE